MSKKATNVVVSAESMRTILAPIYHLLEVTANARTIWARTDSRKAEKALEAAGFKYAAKKNAWYFTYAEDYTPAKFAEAKKARAQKAQETQPKAEKKFAELPQAQMAQISHECAMAFPGCAVQIIGTWVWVSGEATREHKEALKAEGFKWSSKRVAWYKAIEVADAPAREETAEEKATREFAHALAEKTLAHKVEMPTIAEEIGLVPEEPKAQKPRAKKSAKKNAESPAMAMLF